jgi:hypothetical protein
MQERLTLPDRLAQTREVRHLFDQYVGPWTPTFMMSDLAAEGGTLADRIMIDLSDKVAQSPLGSPEAYSASVLHMRDRSTLVDLSLAYRPGSRGQWLLPPVHDVRKRHMGLIYA